MRQKAGLSLVVVLVTLMALVALAQATVPAFRVEAQEGGAVVHNLGGSGVLHIAGASFVPESDATVYTTYGEGDVFVTGGSQRWMHAPVLLPDGALVSGLTFYYKDNHASSNMAARLYRNNDPGIGARRMLAEAFSSTAPPEYNSAYSATTPSPVEIDNGRYNYEVEVQWSLGSSDLRLMSVKLFYTNP